MWNPNLFQEGKQMATEKHSTVPLIGIKVQFAAKHADSLPHEKPSLG